MKFGTWLLVAALVCAAGCSSSDKQPANQGDSKAVSEALSSGIAFKNGKKLSGLIPKATATDVDVQGDAAPVTLAPEDGEAIMSLDADNPDEADDPIEAMLIQFEDSQDHFEVGVDGSGDGGVADGGTGSQTYNVKFSADEGICKSFCKGQFTVLMIQAFKLHKGGVTRHVNRDLKLDCRKAGAEVCEKDKPATSSGGSKDAGTSSADSGSSGGGGASGSSTNSGLAVLNSGLSRFSMNACTCAGQTTKFCSAGLTMEQFTCIGDAIKANGQAADDWASCAGTEIKTMATSCMGACGTDACTLDLSADTFPRCSVLNDKAQGAVDACGVGGGDAGTP